MWAVGLRVLNAGYATRHLCAHRPIPQSLSSEPGAAFPTFPSPSLHLFTSYTEAVLNQQLHSAPDHLTLSTHEAGNSLTPFHA
jgi:hypothetical protein